MSIRTAPWPVAALVGVLLTFFTCIVGDIALHLQTAYGASPVLRAAARPLTYTDAVLLVAYRMAHRYRTSTAGAVTISRVAVVAWRWLWLPFVLVPLLAGVSVLTLPPTELVGSPGRTLTVFLVPVVPLATWYLAQISGRPLASATGHPTRTLGLSISRSVGT